MSRGSGSARSSSRARPVELLAAACRAARGRALPAWRATSTGASPTFPEPQSSDPETERYLLFNAVAGLLGEVAETVPLCVVLDDLHWADAQSLALLKHLLRSTEQGALQVIATYRDSDLGKDHPLTAVLADLRSLQGCSASPCTASVRTRWPRS